MSLTFALAAQAAELPDVYDVIGAPEPAYTDVEPALRAAFDFRDPNLRATAAHFWGDLLAMPTDSLEYLRGRDHQVEVMRKLLPTSAYWRDARGQVLRLLDLLDLPARAMTVRRPISEAQAWRRARRDVLARYPAAERDPAGHAHEFRRTYLRQLNREDLAREPERRPPVAAEVLHHLARLRQSLIQDALAHFFEPTELSLFEPLEIDHGNGIRQSVNEHRRTFRSHAELRAITWSSVGNKVLRPEGQHYKLGLTKPSGAHGNFGLRVVGEVYEVTAMNVGDLAFSQKEFTLEGLTHLMVYEARYTRRLAWWLNEAMNELSDGRGVQATLNRLRTRVINDLDQTDFHDSLRRADNAAQYHYLVRTFGAPDYFRARDERARALGRPSLLEKLRQADRAPLPWHARAWRTFEDTLTQWSARITRSGARAPRNNSWRRDREDRRHTVFAYEGAAAAAPLRLTFDVPDVWAIDEDRLQAWTPVNRPTAFALTRLEPARPQNGRVPLPASGRGRLARLDVFADGRPLPAAEYEVRTDALNDHSYLTLQVNQPITYRAEYARTTLPYAPAARELDLDDLPRPALAHVVGELRRARLTRLANGLDDLLRRTSRVSARQIKWVIWRESRYSFDTNREFRAVRSAEGPFAPFSGFLNARGLLCMQCDGSNALAVTLFNRVFEDHPEIEARDVSCHVREPFAAAITRAHGHCRTQFFVRGVRAATLDATALLWDVAGLFARDRDETSPDEGDEAAREDELAERIADAQINGVDDEVTAQLAALAERLGELRRRLLSHRSVERAFGYDLTAPVPRALSLSKDVDQRPLDQVLELIVEANRYRGYLLDGPAHGLEDDPLARADLDALLAEVAGAVRILEHLGELTCANLLVPDLGVLDQARVVGAQEGVAF